MNMNSVDFLPISALVKRKIKPYHIVRFPLPLLTHCYFHSYQYVFALPAVILLNWRERKRSQVLIILILEINVAIKRSINIMKTNLTFRKNKTVSWRQVFTSLWTEIRQVQGM